MIYQCFIKLWWYHFYTMSEEHFVIGQVKIQAKSPKIIWCYTTLTPYNFIEWMIGKIVTVRLSSL
jgi:hypothetical protein